MKNKIYRWKNESKIYSNFISMRANTTIASEAIRNRLITTSFWWRISLASSAFVVFTFTQSIILWLNDASGGFSWCWCNVHLFLLESLILQFFTHEFKFMRNCTLVVNSSVKVTQEQIGCDRRCKRIKSSISHISLSRKGKRKNANKCPKKININSLDRY